MGSEVADGGELIVVHELGLPLRQRLLRVRRVVHLNIRREENQLSVDLRETNYHDPGQVDRPFCSSQFQAVLRILIQRGPWIRIQEGKNDPQKQKKASHAAGCPLRRPRDK